MAHLSHRNISAGPCFHVSPGVQDTAVCSHQQRNNEWGSWCCHVTLSVMNWTAPCSVLQVPSHQRRMKMDDKGPSRGSALCGPPSAKAEETVSIRAQKNVSGVWKSWWRGCGCWSHFFFLTDLTHKLLMLRVECCCTHRLLSSWLLVCLICASSSPLMRHRKCWLNFLFLYLVQRFLEKCGQGCLKKERRAWSERQRCV